MYSLKTTSTLNLALNSYVVSFPNVLYSCSVGTSMRSVETTFWSLARDCKISLRLESRSPINNKIVTNLSAAPQFVSQNRGRKYGCCFSCLH